MQSVPLSHAFAASSPFTEMGASFNTETRCVATWISPQGLVGLAFGHDLGRDLEHEIGALLYRRYIKDMNWSFSLDNPSNIRVETSATGDRILTDDFVKRALYAFVLDEDEKVAGVMRAIPEAEELKLYPLTSHMWSLKSSQPVVEINRAAVRLEPPAPEGTMKLLEFAMLKASQEGWGDPRSMILAPANKTLLRRYRG